MPPLRFPRPPRLCHPSRSSLQIRWSSNGPHDERTKSDERGVTVYPQSGAHREADQGKSPENRDAHPTETEDCTKQPSRPETPSIRWVRSVSSRMSALFERPVPIADNGQPRLPRPAELHPSPYQEKELQHTRSGCQSTVTSQIVQTPPKEHETARPLPYLSLQAKGGVNVFPGAPRVCKTCQAEFPTRHEFWNHMVMSDSCWVEPTGIAYIYECGKCNQTFATKAEARQHLHESPTCDGYVEFHRAIRNDIQSILKAAGKLYRRSTFALLYAAYDLDAMSFPHIKPIAGNVDKRLRHLWKDAELENDKDMLSILKRDRDRFQPRHETSMSSGPASANKARVLVRRGEHEDRTKKVERAASVEQQSTHHVTADEAQASPSKGTDLRAQVQQLKEQVKMLQERLSTPQPPQDSLAMAAMGNPRNTKAAALGIASPGNSAPVSGAMSPGTADEEILLGESSIEASPVDHEISTKGGTVEDPQETDTRRPLSVDEMSPESENYNERSARQRPTQTELMQSTDSPSSANSSTPADSSQSPTNSNSSVAEPAPTETNERSLFEELFPEASGYVQPYYSGRNPYPKLDLPNYTPLVQRSASNVRKSDRERMMESFLEGGERITALQLLHCSTELTEADFRRIIPKGKHIEGWARGGEFYKVIPGRDPLSLERLPFYYLLFRSAASAFAYQSNASRLHKLCQLHQRNDIFSAIPPPKGYLENGEDIGLATSSFVLLPTGSKLRLNMVMKPYTDALRALFERGGYIPITPSVHDTGKRIFKVLMHIGGYEPSPMDLYQLLSQDGFIRGIQWPFYKDYAGVHRLRDVVDLKGRFDRLSVENPRAQRKASRVSDDSTHEDSPIDPLTGADLDEGAQLHQTVMNRLYNRWVIEFEEEEAAKRFSRLWNRRVLPVSVSAKHVTWRDIEEVRMCNTELLW